MAPGAGKRKAPSDAPPELQPQAKRATLEVSKTVLLTSMVHPKLLRAKARPKVWLQQYDPLALPSGWERCPRLGHAVKIAGLTFIPSKV